MVPFFDAREKTAARLLDVASALDAGLPPKTALRVDEADLKDGVAAAVVRAIPGLDDVDLRILEAAERAGDLSAALRERAEAKLQHAGVARDLVRRLAYPAFVLAFAVVLSLWLASVGQAGFSSKAVTLLALAPLACAAAVVVVVRRARRDPGFDAARVPLLGAVLRDAAELPYLIALRGLHAAGVLIADAHATAAATSGVAHVRARLAAATEALRRGESLSDALRERAAVCTETLEILGTSERAGDLEDGLGRAAARRRDVLTRRLASLGALAGGIGYVLAVVSVALIVLDFYGRIGSRIGR